MIKGIIIFVLLSFHVSAFAGVDSTLVLKKVIRGSLAPKSVVHSGTGLFFAQNMMYKHTIAVFNRNYELVKTISDNVRPKDFGIDTITGSLSGGPVEAAFSHNGKYAWISNYNMSGDKFSNPGCDGCYNSGYDNSFLYKINTNTLKIENIVQVGSVPKYVAVSPDNKYVLVSNWTSGDVSVIDTETNKEIKRIRAGRFPRGIVVDSKSQYAYVAIMGSKQVMKINLENFQTTKFHDVGGGPRHLCITSDDSLLYVSLNNDGKIARINLADETIEKTDCGGAPRSMILSHDDKYLYVVNYSINKISKLDLQNFKIVEQHETKTHPIGITFDAKEKDVWVACYSGTIMVYHDSNYKPEEWYDVFNFSDQISDAVDYLGRISESFLASAGNTQDISARPVVRLKNEEPKTFSTEAVQPAEKKKLKKSKEKENKAQPVAAKNATVKKTTVSAETPVDGNFYVVVGSFKNADNAYRLTDKLKAKGYSAMALKSKNGMIYAAIGGFTDDSDAKDAMEKIKMAEGMDAWIYKL